jgi:hypothetical protein
MDPLALLVCVSAFLAGNYSFLPNGVRANSVHMQSSKCDQLEKNIIRFLTSPESSVEVVNITDNKQHLLFEH